MTPSTTMVTHVSPALGSPLCSFSASPSMTCRTVYPTPAPPALLCSFESQNLGHYLSFLDLELCSPVSAFTPRMKRGWPTNTPLTFGDVGLNHKCSWNSNSFLKNSGFFNCDKSTRTPPPPKKKFSIITIFKLHLRGLSTSTRMCELYPPTIPREALLPWKVSPWDGKGGINCPVDPLSPRMGQVTFRKILLRLWGIGRH